MTRHLTLIRPHEESATRAFIVAESRVSERPVEELALQLRHTKRSVYRWFSGEASVNVGAVLSGPQDVAYEFLRAYLSEVQPGLEVRVVAANDNAKEAA